MLRKSLLCFVIMQIMLSGCKCVIEEVRMALFVCLLCFLSFSVHETLKLNVQL